MAQAANNDVMCMSEMFNTEIILWLFVFVIILMLISLCIVCYWIPKCIAEPFLNHFNVTCSLKKNKDYKNSKMIAITLDDVPFTSKSFKQILTLFKKYQIKMSCMVISDYVNDDTQQLLIEAVNDGHVLCNHGKTDSMHAFHSIDSLKNEIKDCETKLNEIYQKQCNQDWKYKFYRPGCGIFTNKMLKLLESMGYNIILGNVYPNDPFCCNSWWNFQYLKWHIDSGDVIILHDRPWTINLLKKLLPWIKEQGYECITLNQVF